MKAKHWQFLIAAVTVLLLVAQGCKSANTASTAPAPTVPVTTVSPANLENDLTLSAEFLPYQEVDVMAKVAGYIKTIRVDIGSQVAQGEVLATLDVPELQDDLSKAKAAVASASANISTELAAVQRMQASENIASLSLQRIRDVAKRDKGLVPQQEIDVAQAHQLEAVAQLASAKSALIVAEQNKAQAQSEYERAQAWLQYATIRAPFEGVITKRYANTGSMIQAGISSQTQAMPVVRLAENRILRLTIPIPVNAVPGIRDGQVVEINIKNTGRTIKGRITRYTNSIQTTTRTMNAEVDVQNTDGSIVPGMYAEVHVHLESHTAPLSVPTDAIEGLGTSVQQVYLVRHGIVHIAAVQIGMQTPSRIEILSGIQPGDQVIVGRHAGIFDGEQVTPKQATYENKIGE